MDAASTEHALQNDEIIEGRGILNQIRNFILFRSVYRLWSRLRRSVRAIKRRLDDRIMNFLLALWIYYRSENRTAIFLLRRAFAASENLERATRIFDERMIEASTNIDATTGIIFDIYYREIFPISKVLQLGISLYRLYISILRYMLASSRYYDARGKYSFTVHVLNVGTFPLLEMLNEDNE